MRTYVYYFLAIAAAVGGMGYVRGWFGPPRPVNRLVRVEYIDDNPDRSEYGQIVDVKSRAIKAQFASLDQKSGELTGDAKVQMLNTVANLKTDHIRLEEQILKLNTSANDTYETQKELLSKALENIEKQLEVITLKLKKQSGA
ncbi:hypothetical protein BH11PLA2_BH11PLA2_40940 [soil metagenome]